MIRKPASRLVALLCGLASQNFAAAGLLPERALSFEERCRDPKVVLCDPLDSGRVVGVGVTAATPFATLPEALRGKYRDWRWCVTPRGANVIPPAMDSDVKSSGSGSVRFTIPSQSAANAAGYCQISFTPDHSIQFGEGDTFFVQYRVRLSCTLLFTDCDPNSPDYKLERRSFRGKKNPTAFKISIINAGDHPDLPQPVSSCTLQHLVLIGNPKGALTGYHSCGWYDGHSQYHGLHRKSGNGLYDIQPKRAASDSTTRPCYNIDADTGAKLRVAWRDCILLQADEWLTITQQVSVTTWADKVKDPRHLSTIRVWIAREGMKPEAVIDFDRTLRRPERPFMKYGKIWLLPYMTDKDVSEVHPEAYMWFDELIVSRAPIAPAR